MPAWKRRHIPASLRRWMEILRAALHRWYRASESRLSGRRRLDLERLEAIEAAGSLLVLPTALGAVALVHAAGHANETPAQEKPLPLAHSSEKSFIEQDRALSDLVFSHPMSQDGPFSFASRVQAGADPFASADDAEPKHTANDKQLDPVMAADNALVDPASHLADQPKANPHHAAPPTGNALNTPPPNLAGAGQGPGGTSTPFSAGGGNGAGGGGGAADPLHGLNRAMSETSTNGANAAMAAQVRPATASGLTPGGDPPIPFVEGTSANQIVGTFTDSDGNTDPTKYTASIDWGNGQQTTGFVTFSSGQFQIQGVMAYADEGNYPITTTVTDQDGAITTVTASAAVSDAALTPGTTTPISATAGQAYSGQFAHFSDANQNAPASDFSVQINWGDGQNSAGMATATGSGGFNVSGSHTYAAAGTYAVSATVTDDGGSQTTLNTTANVAAATTPVAVNDMYSLDQGDTLSLSAVGGVLANDSDPHGLPLSAVLVSNATHGTVSLSSDGSFTYTPTANFSGTDSFTYYATDGQQNSNTTTVTLEVTPTVLTAINDTYSVQSNTLRTVDAAQGLLANDTDSTGSPLTALLVSGPSNGTLTLNLDGSFTYTPNTGYTGTDSFQYEANDGTQDSNVASVSLTVHGTNTAPVAVNDSYAVQHDQIFSVNGSGVLANDSDADGDPLTASLVSGSGPAHGTLTLSPDGFFSYTPNAGYTGTDNFQYLANDGLANSAPATVTLNVTDPNPPVANNDSYGVNANAPLTVAAGIGVLANDSDADGDPLTAALVAGSGPNHGTVTLNSDGSFTYTPNAGYAGSDSFQYTVSDGVLTSTATVTLNVHASNTAPVASADSYSILHDQTLNIFAPGVLSNDTDVDGDPLTASVVAQPSQGTLTLNSDGSFSYTPNAGYIGTDSFQYAASDGLASSTAATVTISVTDPNAPVAVADSFSVQKNGELDTFTNTVLANDTDADGDPLSANLVSGSGPSHGSLSFNPDGSFTYIPNAGYVGTDNFQYTASDGALSSNPATVSISVTNSAPVALNDTYTVLHDTTLNVPAAGLLANDFDPNGDSLTTTLATRPQHGMVTVNSDGSFSYTPGAGYTGTDSFTYTASDGSLTSSPATVTITVKAINQPPSANADSYSLPHDAPLQTTASNGVLANDTDPDGDPLLAKLTSGPSHGTLSLNVDGSFTYTPTAGYFGPDSFAYQAFDGTTVSSPATVSLTVTNDAPVAVNDTISVLSSGTTAVPTNEGVLVNDTDGEDDTLTAQLVSNPSNGTLTLNSDGSFNYTPGAGFSGTDSFTYKASDGVNLSNVVTVTLTTGPVALAGSYSVNHDTTLTVTSDEGVLLDDTDASGAALTATAVTQPSHGTLVLNADGSFTYTPNAGYVGTDSFQYTASDGSLTSSPATVTIQVVNNAPVGTSSTFDVLENTTLTVSGADLTGADYDPEDDAITAVGPSSLRLSHGSLSYFNSDGTFQYTPDTGFVGTDQFYYQLTDGLAMSTPIPVTLNVNATANPTVDFIPINRGTGRVVAARNTDEGMPGGQMQLDIKVPGTGDATLTIAKTAGASGSAVFIVDKKEANSVTVTKGKTTTITIAGRDVSDVARNMQIQAKINNQTVGSWAFTVFEVTPTLLIDPTTRIVDAIPNSATNYAGGSLVAGLLKATNNHPNLGYHHYPDQAYGGIVMRGKITPGGLLSTDFNLTHSRFSAFNWDQKVTDRSYINGALQSTPIPKLNFTDDPNDLFEDNVPGLVPALGITNLYIWDTDAPAIFPAFIKFVGERGQTRTQFETVVQYAGVNVSPTYYWFFDAAAVHTTTVRFQQDNSYAIRGDNTISTGLTRLTADLLRSNAPPLKVLSFQPAIALTGKNNIPFTMTTNKLPPAIQPGALVAYLVREDNGDKKSERDTIPLQISARRDKASQTIFSGTFSVPPSIGGFPLLGGYTLDVFIADGFSSTVGPTIQKPS